MSATSVPLTADAPATPVVARSERTRVIGTSLAIFVFTFLVYYLTGPVNTPYDFQLSQANNIIHGHLDMTEESLQLANYGEYLRPRPPIAAA